MTRREIPVVVAQVRAETDRLDTTAAMVSDTLAESRQEGRTAARLALLCTRLHSFYNGVERVFDTIAREVDQHQPQGPSSHRDLLNQMTVAVEGLRDAVLDEDLARRLRPYLDFRHRFRHLYFFDVEWEDVERLAERLSEVWAAARTRIREFAEELDEVRE